MASPSGNPNTSSPFELGKLFKPPNPNPIPNPTSPFYAATAGGAPPPFTAAPGLTGPYSYPSATPPFHHRPYLHYPQDPLPRPYQIQNPSPSPSPSPNPSPNPNPNPGARLMQLLGNAAPTQLESAVSLPPSDLVAAAAAAQPAVLQAVPSAPPAIMAGVPQPVGGPTRMPSSSSSKMPRGRLLSGGDHAVHDVDSRLPGEAQPPQLEVTPITKYTSDPGLVLGRQIAVNRTYIVYGLKLGNIRVLNINTALRSLLRGHTQRVTDMAFFAEDVHRLASASVDGRIFLWKINEGPDEENKPQITGKIEIAIQIVGGAESYHPRICWHSHKQEILFVGIGSSVLRIETTKVGRGREITAEEPLKCPLEKLIDGVYLVGKHDGDVTDLSISQWMTTRLASASKDGTVKIWDDRKAVPLSVLKPHDGQAVNSVAFLTSPDRPDHINLVTAGPLNREVKIWASTNDEGWLLSSDSESWKCMQTLDLISSLEPRIEEAFFNQVAVLPQASLILLANAKKNAIYAVHVEYGSDPASTRMDYIADFTVAMPILSLTGTHECQPDGEQVVQVYCVQTMAIQQYALELSLCLPPTADNTGVGRDPAISRVFDSPSEVATQLSTGSSVTDFSAVGASAQSSHGDQITENAIATSNPVTSPHSEAVISSQEFDTKPSAPPLTYAEADASNHVTSYPLTSKVDLAGSPTGPSKGPSLGDRDVDQSALDYLNSRRLESDVANVQDTPIRNDSLGKDEPRTGQSDVSMVPNPRLLFKVGGNATHLVTPSEILSGALPSTESNHVTKAEEGKTQDVIANSSSQSAEVEQKRMDERKSSQTVETEAIKEAQIVSGENKEKASKFLLEQTVEMLSERSVTTDKYNVEPSRAVSDGAVSESLQRPSGTAEENVQKRTKDMPEKVEDSSASRGLQSPLATKEKEKVQHFQASASPSPSTSTFNSFDSSNEPGANANPPKDAALPQISAIQDTLQQLMTMQKDLQKQFSTMIAVPVTKECKRIEASLGRNMEKIVKANSDATWVRIQEENAKHEKTERERMQQITTLVTNCISKDLPSILERSLKKEISSLGPAVARAMTPVVEKSISSAVVDSLQKVVGDKVVNQLDKSVSSKLEATVARQIQAQFHTSGKQALQDALRSCLESSVIPAFEQSCKTMFEQVDSAFQRGMSEHTAAVQQQVDAAHTPLALTLRDTINSASSITQSLTTELLDGQRKLLALVASGSTKALNPTILQSSNGPMAGLPEVEAPVDPMKELSRLISERKFEEAFTMALQRSDVSIVSWLCSQVDLHGLCSMVPVPLNQGVLLALLQQLACDIGNETSRKVAWMTDVAVAINPTDPMIAMHVRPIFEQVYNILAHQRSLPTTTTSEGANIRLIMHVINSVLLSYK